MPILRDILLRFVTAAFLLQLLVPFYAVYGVSASHAQAALENPQVFGDKVLICTRDGFAYVSWETLANDEETRNSQHKNLKCPSCYVQAKAMSMDVAQPHAMLYVVPPKAQQVAMVRDAMVAKTLTLQHRVRAPPAV